MNSAKQLYARAAHLSAMLPGHRALAEVLYFPPRQPATIINHAVIAGPQKPVPRRLSGNSIAISARARVINSGDKNARGERTDSPGFVGET